MLNLGLSGYNTDWATLVFDEVSFFVLFSSRKMTISFQANLEVNMLHRSAVLTLPYCHRPSTMAVVRSVDDGHPERPMLSAHAAVFCSRHCNFRAPYSIPAFSFGLGTEDLRLSLEGHSTTRGDPPKRRETASKHRYE